MPFKTAAASVRPFVHGLQPAEIGVETDTGFKIAHVKSDMGQRRRHSGVRLLPSRKRRKRQALEHSAVNRAAIAL